MTFFCRQPSRLIVQFGAVRSQTSARLAHHVRIALPTTKPGLFMRSASNAAAPAQTTYPRRLLIYRAPTTELATIGTIKLTGLGAFAIACLVIAPNVYWDESSPLWMAPAVIAVSATLLPLFHVLTRPSIANIFIDVPATARRSKEALISFAKRLPPDTALEIQTLGLLPAPRTKTLRVGELRIRPEGWGRLANLEQVHEIDKTSKIPKWARWSLQRFYARPVASRWKNSRAPEVWPLVYEAITRNTVANMSKKNLSPPTGIVPPARPQLSASVVRPGQPSASVVQKKVPAPKAAPKARRVAPTFILPYPLINPFEFDVQIFHIATPKSRDISDTTIAAVQPQQEIFQRAQYFWCLERNKHIERWLSANDQDCPDIYATYINDANMVVYRKRVGKSTEHDQRMLTFLEQYPTTYANVIVEFTWYKANILQGKN
ncbi:hypothetical protein QM012_001580 [Aureobasidium pullulans]|uniref:Uncharacterized protein n=1 Tax=Aureobasidium pullulans TaxID=5580 RepID=A0ABR0TFU1_AURPU